MSDTVQDLAREFPEKVWKIHRLVETDSEFARLYEEYTDLTQAVLQAETTPNGNGNGTKTGAQMRQTRADLKIRIWDYLKH